MATDTERSYQGTNFVVISLIVLLVLVGGYFAVAQINDVSDDPATVDMTQSFGGGESTNTPTQE